MNEKMIPYERALDILSEQGFSSKEQTLPLNDCRGCFLAESIKADRNFPPFDRVSRDGIALQSQAFYEGLREFFIAGVAPAGTEQMELKEKKSCIEVMTGAILPKNSDAVVPYEDLKIDEGKALLEVKNIQARQHIHPEGVDVGRGEVILPKGRQISSAEINILAAVGKSVVKVFKLPQAVIVSTGDELVPIDQKPHLFQIRRSNVYGIKSTLQSWGVPADLAHLKDDKEAMFTAVSKMLKEYDLLIFTGGVSKGKFDYLPEVLEALGVKKLFYKIKQRPGKPFWFGKTVDGKYVFALPGNPVSSFVCIYVYFRHWLLSSLQIEKDRRYHVLLKDDVEFMPDLTYFLEAKITSSTTGVLEAAVKQGNGSGDFVNLASADGFLILPREKSYFKKGEIYPFVFYKDHR